MANTKPVGIAYSDPALTSGTTIDGATITGATITSSSVSGVTTTSGSFASPTITTPTITGGTYTSGALSGGTIAGAAITTSTISGGTISGAAITTSSGAFTTLTASGATTLNGNVEVGDAITDTVGFYGVTAITQPANAAQAALTLTTALSSGFGFTTATAFNAFTAQLENIRASLVLFGLLKGAA